MKQAESYVPKETIPHGTGKITSYSKWVDGSGLYRWTKCAPHFYSKPPWRYHYISNYYAFWTLKNPMLAPISPYIQIYIMHSIYVDKVHFILLAFWIGKQHLQKKWNEKKIRSHTNIISIPYISTVCNSGTYLLSFTEYDHKIIFWFRSNHITPSHHQRNQHLSSPSSIHSLNVNLPPVVIKKTSI